MSAQQHSDKTVNPTSNQTMNFFPDEIKDVIFERHQKAFSYEINNRIFQSRDKQKWCQKV
jgi:hypothetical protein